MIWRSITLLLLFAISIGKLGAQENAPDHAKIKLEPVFSLQLWSTFTHGEQLYDRATDNFENVDNRINFQLRRSRIGIKGSWGTRTSFNLIGAADLVGRDGLSGTEAGANNGPSPFFRLWSAALQFRASPKTDWANITLGYFSPRIGRESMTPHRESPSMEKAWSQNYLRRHLVGTGPGRAVGINIGGRADLGQKLSVGYDAGVFNAAMSAFDGGSQGRIASPLLTARVHVTVGDAEKPFYKKGYKVDYSGERSGITIGAAVAWQDRSNDWTQSGTFTIDLLANYGGWSLDGDWSFMKRTPSTSSLMANSQTGYLRLANSFRIRNGQHIQPSVTQVWFLGETEFLSQTLAYNASMPSGSERITELAVNWLLNRNLKISLAYTMRSADAGEVGEELGPNNYFSQPNVGIIKRGNWFGLGLLATL